MKVGTLIKGIIAVIVIIGVLFGGYLFTNGDFKNKMLRKGIEHNNHDYQVTVSLDGGYLKAFDVVDGKVTAYPTKGYYAFWVTVDGDKKYVQAPIRSTVVIQAD